MTLGAAAAASVRLTQGVSHRVEPEPAEMAIGTKR
jgi:hypothetical protein